MRVYKSILEAHSSRGYTVEVKNDSYKREIVEERVRHRLTDHRAVIKYAVCSQFFVHMA